MKGFLSDFREISGVPPLYIDLVSADKSEQLDLMEELDVKEDAYFFGNDFDRLGRFC